MTSYVENGKLDYIKTIVVNANNLGDMEVSYTYHRSFEYFVSDHDKNKKEARMNITDIKNHIETFIVKAEKAIGSEEHILVTKFVDFIEGKQKEEYAVELLTSIGYSVVPPAAPVAPVTPVTVPEGEVNVM